MDTNLESIKSAAVAGFTVFGVKVLGAIAAWLVCRYLIRLAGRLVAAALNRQRVEPTLVHYVSVLINIVLTVVLVVGLLGYFGFETTSFAALLAAVGLAIGAAWSGLLANFAAGAFLIVLKPFKVGDFVKAGGLDGTVREIGLFATTILTPDNVVSFVGNGKIFADTIQNFSASPHRRVERTAQLAHTVNVQEAVLRLKEAVARIPNVEKDPAPTVEILDFTARGPVLAVRPHTAPQHYWQVYFDTNRAIVDTFGAAGYPVPEEHVRMHSVAAKA